MAVIPRTEEILKILEPIRFPREIAFSCFRAAITEAASSGTLVPTATIVTEITRSLTPYERAISLAPNTNQTLPKDSAAPPISNQKKILNFYVFSKASSTSQQTPLELLWNV